MVSYLSTVKSMAIYRSNRRKQSGSMSKARTVCTTAFSTGSSERPAARSAKKRSPKAASVASLSSTDALEPKSSTMSSA